jgi:hypothetical protein
MVVSKSRDGAKLQSLFRSKDTNWKAVAVEMFYADFCENLMPSEHKYSSTQEEIRVLSELCTKYVQDLRISGVQQERKELLNKFNDDIKMINYRPQDCAHCSFDFIYQLPNMESLSISFKPKVVPSRGYERRFFHVAPEDIRNLAVGLKSLRRLHTLEISGNLREGEKIAHLLASLQDSNSLHNLSLTHCSINSEIAGGHFAKFLSKNSSLEKIDLSYNDLGYGFCRHFAMGIESSSHNLKCLGLAMTGIFYNGLDVILKSISKRDSVWELNISCCEGECVDENNAAIEELENLMKKSSHLQILNMASNKIRDQSKRSKLIQALECNSSILSLDCFNCGM